MIYQLTEALTRGDAISSAVLTMDALMKKQGIACGLFVGRGGDHCAAGACSADRLPSVLEETDWLFYQYSTGSALNDFFAVQKCHRVLVYQNITPAEYFEPYDPVLADRLRWGREQLRSIVPTLDFAIASSEYSAGELRALGCERVYVLSVPVDFSRHEGEADAALKAKLSDGKQNILFVGRQVPNKCIEDVLLFADYYAAASGDNCRVVLAGDRSLRSYGSKIDALPLSVEVCNVGRVSQARLRACYETAALFLCMSEHEGFCVPLLESMHYGVPILAYAAAAVPETLGQGGQLFAEKEFLTVAERIYTLLHDEEERENTLRAQKRRLEDFSGEKIMERFAEILDAESVE